MPTSPGSQSRYHPDELITVGVILGAHGRDGRIRVQPETDNPQRFRRGARLIVRERDVHIGHVQRTSTGHLLVRLAEVATRRDAAELHGEMLYVTTDEAPEAPPGAYYHYQLVGMSVSDELGGRLGTLTEIITTGANDVYVVTAETAELLLPAVGDVVVDVDVEAGHMTVAVPDGLAWRTLRPPRVNPKPRRRPTRRPGPATGG